MPTTTTTTTTTITTLYIVGGTHRSPIEGLAIDERMLKFLTAKYPEKTHLYFKLNTRIMMKTKTIR
jgi:hypothetical protein